MDLGLLLLRVVVGGTMAAHGAQKLFGWLGGGGIAGTGGWLESMGFRHGRSQAALVGWSEFGGGLLLALGLFTPFAAAAVIGVMMVAIAIVHWNNGFFNTAGGYEFNLLMLTAAATFAFAGPGDYSLDSALELGLSGVAWGFAALMLGAIGATLTLIIRGSVPVAPEPSSTEDIVVDLSEQKEPISADR